MAQLTYTEKQLMSSLVERYAVAPNETLFECLDRFGKQEFQDAMRILLPHHLVDVAMKIAIRRCLVKQRIEEAHYELVS